jgi:hypothetical protein
MESKEPTVSEMKKQSEENPEKDLAVAPTVTLSKGESVAQEMDVPSKAVGSVGPAVTHAANVTMPIETKRKSRNIHNLRLNL